MRILYHHRTLGEGAEGIHIAGMIDAFRKLGHEVEIIALVAADGANEDTGDKKTARRQLGKLLQRMPRAFYELAELGYNVKGYTDTMRAIRRFKPDFIYDRYNLFNVSVVAAARRAGVPVVLEVNTPYAYQRAKYEKLSLKRFARWIEKKTWEKADQILVVSSPLKQYLLDVGIREELVEVLPNGVDLDLFDPERAPAKPPGEIVIGFVGSVRRWHGVDLLLHAAAPLMRANPALRLVIVGDGEMREQLEREADELGVSGAVEFLGWVSRDAIRDVVARFDIAVSPRSVFYQSPMKIVEYMAMRKAVVAPDKGNIRDLIDGEAEEGLLVAEDDLDALRQALERLVGDGELRRRLGERARRKVEQRLNWVGNARRVLELHRAVAGRTGNGSGA